MNNLGLFVCIYLALSILIGFYSTKFIHSSKDFSLAGRNLPLLLCSSTMFSTWFGAETVVGSSAEFLEHGLLGVIEDPFGTSLCFLLVGLFIAKPLYKLDIITVVDLFRLKYGETFEKISAVFMILSYIGWLAAQLVAMSIILNLVFEMPVFYGVMLSSFVVCLYTVCGGMWSVSINDFIQTIVIVLGLLAVCFFVYIHSDPYQSINEYTDKTMSMGKIFQFIPDSNFNAWSNYLVAWITIGLGSIPQQDVFQRVMSARSERTAVASAYISSILYLIIGLLPLAITLAFVAIDSSLQDLPRDQVLLQGILRNTNDILKTIFIGALLSAIMSSASGAVLAPATILAENIIKPLKSNITDHGMLIALRLSVVASVIAAALHAIYTPDIRALVAESSIVGLVTLFAPFMAALYWKNANKNAAFYSIIAGPLVLLLAIYLGLSYSNSILLGLGANIFCMFVPAIVIKRDYI